MTDCLRLTDRDSKATKTYAFESIRSLGFFSFFLSCFFWGGSVLPQRGGCIHQINSHSVQERLAAARPVACRSLLLWPPGPALGCSVVRRSPCPCRWCRRRRRGLLAPLQRGERRGGEGAGEGPPHLGGRGWLRKEVQSGSVERLPSRLLRDDGDNQNKSGRKSSQGRSNDCLHFCCDQTTHLPAEQKVLLHEPDGEDVEDCGAEEQPGAEEPGDQRGGQEEAGG